MAGVRNPEDLNGLARRMPEIHVELLESLSRLERHYRDIQDVEYTVEEGRLSSFKHGAPSATPSPRSDLPRTPLPRDFWTEWRHFGRSTLDRSERSCTPRSIPARPES